MSPINLKINNKLNQESLVKVGKITGPHGLDGRVQFIIFSKDYSWVKKIDQILLQTPTNESGLRNTESHTQCFESESSKPKKVGPRNNKDQSSSRSGPFSKEFIVEGVSARSNAAIMRLSEVHNRTEAEKLAGLEIYVRDDLFVSQDSEKPFLREVLNFKIHDPQNLEIGIVVGFSTNSVQDILLVQGQDKAVFEIPFVDAFVKKLDREAKQIVMDLPEGLIEINKN